MKKKAQNFKNKKKAKIQYYNQMNNTKEEGIYEHYKIKRKA